MSSLAARAVTLSLRAQRSKRFYADPALMRRRLPRHQDRRQTRPPRAVTRSVVVRTDVIAGSPCHVLSPVTGSPRAAALHLHGGGFVEQPEQHHWRFLRWLVSTLGLAVVFPIYPLCPAADHREIRARLRAVYEHVRTTRSGPVVVLGDSAGGGAAIDLAVTLREEGVRPPDALALLSPWLDLAVPDTRSILIDPRDPELGVAGLRQAGRWYAADRDLGDPRISPVHADPTGLAPTAVWTGTRDVLNPDAHRFRERAVAAGVPVVFHQHRDMFHNWTMQPIPEGRRARTQIAGFLRAQTG